MIVVSDTSPINYLVLINQVQLLRDLFGRVIVPSAVKLELSHSAAPEAVRRFVSVPPNWIEILSPKVLSTDLPALGAGELEAISLLRELNGELLLCDDLDARRAAISKKFRVMGTLGVVELASRRGLVDARDAIVALRKTSIRLPAALIERLLNDKSGPNPKE